MTAPTEAGAQIMPMGLILPSEPTEAERKLIEMIEEARWEYEQRTKPLFDMLVRLRSLSYSPPMFLPIGEQPRELEFPK